MTFEVWTIQKPRRRAALPLTCRWLRRRRCTLRCSLLKGGFFMTFFLYRSPRPDEMLDSTGSGPIPNPGELKIYADVDEFVVDELLDTLKRYRLRSKVDIENMEDYFSCWQRFGRGLEGKTSSVLPFKIMFIRRYSSKNFRCSLLLLHRSYLASTLCFSKEQLSLNTTNKNYSSSNESSILNQLSEIFPISIHSPSYVDSSCNQLEIKVVDDFLPPEDKLRGVFLQKLSSKTVIHCALGGIDVELNDEMFAKVVNSGDLSGEAMVMFFNWAIEQPNLLEGDGAFHIVLKALGRRKFFVHMMEMVKDMGNRGMNPNSDTLFIIMDSYLRAHRVSKATRIFGELEKYGLECNAEALSVALSCLSQRSHVGTACLLFDRIREKVQCDCSMYNIIIGGWSKFGRVTEVAKFLKQMVDDRVEPDCVTHSYVIEGFGRAGRFNDALKVFRCLEEKVSSLSTDV